MIQLKYFLKITQGGYMSNANFPNGKNLKHLMDATASHLSLEFS